MARKTPGARTSRTSVKAPLLFSAVLAVIAGGAVLIFATGGSERELRWDLALTAAGIVFIVALVIAAMLSMSEKPNAEHLGQGTGINRSSAKIPGGAANAHLRSGGRPGAAAGNTGTAYGSTGTADGSTADDDEAEVGSRAESGTLERRNEEPGVGGDDEPPGPLHPPRS